MKIYIRKLSIRYLHRWRTRGSGIFIAVKNIKYTDTLGRPGVFQFIDTDSSSPPKGGLFSFMEIMNDQKREPGNPRPHRTTGQSWRTAPHRSVKVMRIPATPGTLTLRERPPMPPCSSARPRGFVIY